MSFTGSLLETVQAQLSALARSREMLDTAVRVTTHCLYPSNGLVDVFVRGGKHQATVSDQGGALSEAFGAGIEKRPSDRTLITMMRDRGLKFSDGAIVSPSVPIEEIAAAIILVANASRDLASHLYESANVRVSRDFRVALRTLLKQQFDERVSENEVAGKYKVHTFTNVVTFPNNSRLIIDASTKDASSINARVVANLDVFQLGDPTIKQRIVYDDEEAWSPDDLNVLQMAGAPLVRFSAVQETILRLAHEIQAA